MDTHRKTILLEDAMEEVAAIVRRYGPRMARELELLFEAAAGACRRIQKTRGKKMEDTQNERTD
jgi:hypothetical protein